MSAIQQLIASYVGAVVSGPNGLVRPMLLSRTGRHMQQQTVLGSAAIVLTYPRVNSPLGSAMTESGNGTTGWGYSSSNSSAFAGSGESGKTTMTLASSANGYIRGVVAGTPATTNALRFGFVNSGAASDFPSSPYCLLGDSDYGVCAQYGGGTANGSTTIVPAVGDWIQATRTGSTIVLAVSQNSGSTWTTIHTFSGASTGALQGFVAVSTYASINTITSDVMA